MVEQHYFLPENLVGVLHRREQGVDALEEVFKAVCDSGLDIDSMCRILEPLHRRHREGEKTIERLRCEMDMPPRNILVSSTFLRPTSALNP